jgi:hypothetical protein
MYCLALNKYLQSFYIIMGRYSEDSDDTIIISSDSEEDSQSDEIQNLNSRKHRGKHLFLIIN